MAGAAVTIRSLIKPEMWRIPQTYIMIGLTAAVPLSRISHLWFGGAWPALSSFLVAGIVFFLVVGSVDTTTKLNILAATIAVTALYLLSESLYGYYAEGNESRFVIMQNVEDGLGNVQDQFPRLRSLGFLEDPNDFSQFLVVSIGLLTLA